MSYKNKRVLVTGGLGFIGCNLVRRLIKEKAHVIILDDMYTGRLANLAKYESGIDYSFYQASVGNRDIVRGPVNDTNIIFHLAARNIIASTKDPLEDYRANIGGTLNILMAMKEFPRKKMVYTSSVSVYGNPKYLPINEDDSINLLTPYAVSKYGGESYCMAFHESYGISVTVLRLSNVYGPYQNPSNPYCGVVAKFMDKARKGEKIEIHGDGLSTRDFTYVDDVVDALLLAGLSPKTEGEVFNVATGIETSVYDLAQDIVFLCPEMYDEMLDDIAIKYVDRRDIDNVRRRVLNTEKIRRKLGWTPKTTLAKGLELTKNWMDKDE